MSDMTWKDLRDLECANLRYVGNLWESYTSAMGEQTERLRAEVVDGHLAVEHFESDTADQVREHLKLTAGRFEDDLSDYGDIRIATTMFEAADTIEAEQFELRDLLTLMDERGYEIEGDKHEYEVNPTGELHRSIWLYLDPPQWLCDRVGIDKPSAWYDLVSQAEALGHLNELQDSAEELGKQYQDWLRAIMSRAHDADDDAAAVLAAMREDATELPPQLGATYDELIEEYKTELSEEVAAEMEAIASGESDMSPEQINEWWESLSESEQEALIAEHPEWVGPVDGIPVADRDAANRSALDNEIDSLDEQIASIEDQMAQMEADGTDHLGGRSNPESAEYRELRERLEELHSDRGALDALQDKITNDDGSPASHTLDETTDPPTTQQYYLLGFDADGEGQAIVSIGNPDEADNVNVYVPGTGADLDGASGGLLNRTGTMAKDAYWADPTAETATVLWLGYDAPGNVANATSTSYAEDASEELETFTKGLRSTAEGEASNLTLTGHSYGTTVIGTAASTEGVDADNLVLVASPGASVETADAFGVAENVYATTNSLDPIQLATDTVHGADPTSEEFGANVFESDPGAWNANNHSTYWDETNQKGRNVMAKIITGTQ